jgi:hypothetical protein
MKKYIIISFIAVIGAIALIVTYLNGNFDVVKDASVNSFNDLVISGLDKKHDDSSWIITMPDKASDLILKTDKNVTSVTLSLDATPFLKAGLDAEKLPSYMTVNEDKLYITSVYGSRKLKNNSIAIDNIFNNIVTAYRDKLSYHNTLGHFGLAIGDGNAFEFAKDINNNDKDIVIALNPEVLANASVDVTKVEGFIVADVKMDNGKSVKKLLKVFNIEEVTKCLVTNQSC